jgi:2H phosphodiesterase-like protein
MRITIFKSALTCLLLLNISYVYADNTKEAAGFPCTTSKIQDSGKGTGKAHPQTINITLQQLTDNTGLTYFAGLVAKEDLTPYLTHLADILKNDFVTYRQGQQTRDHNQFHITIVNPYEYKDLGEKQANLLKSDIELSFNLLGLGTASNEKSQTYFVVAASNEGQKLRAALGLNAKDFHVTLGFKPQDVYGVSKNIESLIQ